MPSAPRKMNKTRNLLLLLLVFLLTAASVSAQSSDITLMGEVSPLYTLESPFAEYATTADGDQVVIQVDDIVSEEDRLLIRFFVFDLPEGWEANVTDDERLYGSYLPIAEVIPGDGNTLTPSSASRYTLLNYNGETALSGLLVIETDLQLNAFYLNFNQLPFDTQPLSEGVSRLVNLVEGESDPHEGKAFAEDCVDGLCFTLNASAQTGTFTMLQPTVRMEDEHETLSKFGWITITDAEGNKYAATRGNLYGFNLTDDETWSPAHAYVFAPSESGSPLTIRMKGAHISRELDESETLKVTIGDPNSMQTSEHVKVNSWFYDETAQTLRLYLAIDGYDVSDIAFTYPDIHTAETPASFCGIDPANEEFACDFYLSHVQLENNTLSLSIGEFEYYNDAEWSVTWTPAEMEVEAETAASGYDSTDRYNRFLEPDPALLEPELRDIIEKVSDFGKSIADSGKWIIERRELNYQMAESPLTDLIAVDQYALYTTHYITETASHLSESGALDEIITLTRDTDSGELLSAILRRDYMEVDLLHGLQSENDLTLGSWDYEEDLISLAETSGLYKSSEDCGEDLCLTFEQSLAGSTTSGYQLITYRLDPDSGEVLSSTIDYDNGTLLLTKTLLEISTADSLPRDFAELTEGLILR